MIMSMIKGLAVKVCIFNNYVQRNLSNNLTGEFQSRREQTW
jgi:hypothetical protein